ncbi:MAG: SIR2 family NAD-dependent protein deacylase [Acidobacteriota bacterium]
MDPVSDARRMISESARIIALTGAGMSAESGVPTFRGRGGLWRNYEPQQLATPEAFARDPLLVWEWYNWRRAAIHEAQPNAGHKALAALEQTGRHVTIITQNVDSLHSRAGSTHVIELHGSIWKSVCTGCAAVFWDRRGKLSTLPPLCPECHQMLRPGVVWFGESLPPMAWQASAEACSEAEVLLVIGSSGVVYPAADLAPIARQAGARVIEINLEPTALSSLADLSFHEAAGQILPKLLQ